MMHDAYDLAALRRAYDRDGAVMVPSLIDRAWVGRLRAAVDGVIAKSKTPEAEFEAISGVEVRRTKGGRITIRWMWREIDDVRRFFSESGVAERLGTIIGAKHLRLWFDLTFIHLPGSEDPSGSPWHHDIASFPFSGDHVPSLWITLTDIDPDMSPLRCLRGTHLDRVQYRPPVYVDPNGALPAGFVDAPDFEALVAAGKYEVMTWDHLKAGDALIIHPYTVHGAPGNRSKVNPRIAFSARLLGDDIRWRPTPLSMEMPGFDYAKIVPGSVPDSPRMPIIWRAE